MLGTIEGRGAEVDMAESEESRGGGDAKEGSNPLGLLSDEVYESLRVGIITGRYPQGQKLSEIKLSKDLNVSRISLRSAIPRLEQDGYVVTSPRRSSVVFTWDEHAIADLFDVRLDLEPSAAAAAARKVREGASTENLHAALRNSRASLESGDDLLISQASSEIHRQIAALSGNGLLLKMMDMIFARLVWVFYLTSRRDPAVAYEEHRRICDEILSGQERLSSSMMATHIEEGRVPTIDMIRRMR